MTMVWRVAGWGGERRIWMDKEVVNTTHWTKMSRIGKEGGTRKNKGASGGVNVVREAEADG